MARFTHGLGRRGILVSLTGAVVLAGSLALYGPRGASAQRPAHASFIDLGTVTEAISVGHEPADLDPASNTASGGANIEASMDGTLIALAGSSQNRFQPELATSWSVSANHAVYIFHLRHGVSFHTGRCCLTATDVKYSIARTILAQQAAAYMFSRFMTNPLKQIKVVDPYTVEFDLGRPQYFFLNAIASQYTAQILDAQALKAHASKSDPWAHAWATDHDAGTGPYMLRSWQRGQQVVLTRFTPYWGGWNGPHFNTVIVRTVPDSSTRRELLERGQVDVTTDLTPEDYDALKQNSRVTVDVNYAADVEYIVMTEAGPLASPAARQALSYAFPYDAMIHGVYRGYARRAYGLLTPAMLGYDPNQFHYQTDLARAKTLLLQAGVKPGTVLTFAYFDPYGTMASLLQAQLAQIGITLKLEHLDTAAFNAIFYGTASASKRPNLMAYDWYPDYDDPYDMSDPLVASSSAGANGVNGGYYHNRTVDTLLARMQNADRETLVRDAYKLQDVTGRVDPPAIWVDAPADVIALAANLHGFAFNPVQERIFDFYALHR